MRLQSYVCVGVGLSLGLGALSADASDLRLPQGGRVTVEFLDARDGFPSTLSIAAPAVGVGASGCAAEEAGGLAGRWLVTGRSAQRGCRVTLDADTAAPGVQPFPSGATLNFRLCVQTNPSPACERVWSSLRTANAGGAEHLRTVSLSDGTFRLGWEDLLGGSDPDFDDHIVVVRVDGDRDADGLWDDWETSGIDADGDGDVDLTLPGADPAHKDVFVELDWMSCGVAGSDCGAATHADHQPPREAIDEAVAVYAAAPVDNPDGKPGIRLHVDLSNPIRHQDVLRCSGPPSLAEVKSEPANFGPDNPRRFAYHYGVFGHSQGPDDRGSGGCSEIRGNDFLVTLAAWSSVMVPPSRVRLNAGSLLHELGHNLGLRHGGGDGFDLKPNYLSVMNHRYQYRGLPPDGRLDYSRSALPTLDETSLSELRTLPESVIYACPELDPGTLCMSAPGKPIDWNCNGRTEGGPLVLDLNQDRFCVRPSAEVGSLLETCASDTPACLRDKKEIVFEYGTGGSVFVKSWLSDQPTGENDPPDRTCDNAAEGMDEQRRPVGSRQPRFLVGFSDWNRLAYAFQADPQVADGSEISVQEEVDPDVNGDRPILAVTEFRTSPRRTVTPGSLLTFVSTLANLGGVAAQNVIIEQSLPLGTQFRSCQPQASCRLEGGVVVARVPSMAERTGTFTLTVIVRVSASTPEGTRLLGKVKAREGEPKDPEEARCAPGEPFSPRRAAISVLVSSCPAGTHVIQGTPGADHLEGTEGDDCLLGGDGEDVLEGHGGNDVLIGGGGNDILSGGPGDDRLDGSEGNDQMDGGDGADVLVGGEGEDILAGGYGDDELDGGPGSDQCSGGGSAGDRFLSCEQQSAARLDEDVLAEEESWASGAGSTELSGSQCSSGRPRPAPRI